MSGEVQGRCPSCDHKSLFLGSGGYVTCGIDTCKAPTLAADLLDLGRRLNDLARSGAAVHYIDSVRRELGALLGKEPFAEETAMFIDKLVNGRDPLGGES